MKRTRSPISDVPSRSILTRHISFSSSLKNQHVAGLRGSHCHELSVSLPTPCAGCDAEKAHEEGESCKKDSPTAFDELEGIVSGEHRDIGG